MDLGEFKVVTAEPDFYIVNKPAGIGFHDENQGDESESTGFFNQCQRYFNEKLYPVHRLDKLTSGLVIMARNQAAAKTFMLMFEQKNVEKLYLALSNKKPKKKQGSIIGGMQKARSSKWMLTKSNDNLAVSRFFSWGLQTNIPGLRLFLIKPETGKTHQIRVALKSIGSPILGDTLYGGEAADRGYLHAFALRFEYSGNTFEFLQQPESGELYSSSILQQVTDLDCGFDLNWPKR